METITLVDLHLLDLLILKQLKAKNLMPEIFARTNNIKWYTCAIGVLINILLQKRCGQSLSDVWLHEGGVSLKKKFSLEMCLVAVGDISVVWCHIVCVFWSSCY